MASDGMQGIRTSVIQIYIYIDSYPLMRFQKRAAEGMPSSMSTNNQFPSQALNKETKPYTLNLNPGVSCF